MVEAMEADSGVRLEVLKVDGGVTLNSLCMQIQADVLGVDVVRPKVAETTALGAAYAAGLAVGYWSDPEDLRANWQEDRRWSPQWDDQQRARVTPAGTWRWTAHSAGSTSRVSRLGRRCAARIFAPEMPRVQSPVGNLSPPL